MKKRAATFLVFLGVLGIAGGEVGLHAGLQPVGDWFYCLAWWSWILLASGLVHLRTGHSLLLSHPRAFFLLLPWSTAFWLLFEGLNLRLQNWYYVGLPASWEERLAGMALAFATVLPGILVTAELLGALGLFRGVRSCPWTPSPALRRAFVAAGILCLVLPLAVPRYAFPLTWLFLFLLVEPWLARRDPASLLGLLAAGRPGTLLRLLAAGLVCGGLWEAWNFQTPAHWIYTVPFFESGKLFEMPVPGFLGFLPFALECWTFTRLLVVIGLLPEFLLATASRRAAPPLREEAGLVLAALLAAPLLLVTDLYTVRSTVPMIRDIPGLPAPVAERLEAADCSRVRDLLEAATTGHLPALLAEADQEALTPWLQAARLMALRNMGVRGLSWLRVAGVDSVEVLARADPEDLLQRMLAAPETGLPPRPYEREVRVWVRAAANP